MKSRISRNLEKKTRQNLILSIAGIILVLFLVIRFGLPLLINFSLFLAGIKSSSTLPADSSQFLAAPTFDPTFTATNSAQISLTGSASPNETIKLYVNNSLSDSKTTKQDGSFSFSNVSLQNGENTIKAKAQKGNSESVYSDSITILFKNNPPALSVDSPSDGQSFSQTQNMINVSGKTDANAKVTVNGFWASVNSDGTYTYSLHLQNGDNVVTVIASDDAGNTTQKTLKVHYSQ